MSGIITNIYYYVFVGITLVIGLIYYVYHVKQNTDKKKIKFEFTDDEYNRYCMIAENAINNTVLMFNPENLSDEQKHDKYNEVYKSGSQMMVEEGFIIPALEDRNNVK